MNPIPHRTVKGIPFSLAAICFGTAQFGRSISREQAFELLDCYRELGGNFIDTAHLYGGAGENRGEVIIGDWLRARGIGDMIVATKGCHFDPSNPPVSRVTRACVRADIEESLERLGLEQVPLYWLHRDNESSPIEEIVEFCEELRREGKVCCYGLSNFRAERVRGALAYADRMGYPRIFGVSNEWSLAQEHGALYTDPSGMISMDRELYRLHLRENLLAVPFSAVAHGYFAKLDAGMNPGGSLSRFDTVKNHDLLPVLRRMAAENSVSVHELSAAYLMTAEFPVIPIIATSDPAHLREFVRIVSVRMDADGLRAFAN